MTAATFGGRSRPDLRPVPGEPGVYTDGHSTYIDDTTWERWERERKAENERSRAERDARRERHRRELAAQAEREAREEARRDRIGELAERVAALEHELRVANYVIVARNREVEALARTVADALPPAELQARRDRARINLDRLAVAA